MNNIYLDFILSQKGKDVSLYEIGAGQEPANHVIIQHFNSASENKKFVDLFMEKFGLEKYPEGYNRGEWIILDMGDAIIHSFIADKREKYNLDKMWQSKKVNLNVKNSKK